MSNMMRAFVKARLEMSGSAVACRDLIDAMNHGGKIAILGIAPIGFETDWYKVICKMPVLKGEAATALNASKCPHVPGALKPS